MNVFLDIGAGNFDVGLRGGGLRGGHFVELFSALEDVDSGGASARAAGLLP